MSNFELFLKGAGLTTAEFTFRLPDRPSLVQLFIWQFEDFYPWFPRLAGFCIFWNKNLDGELVGVRVSHNKLGTPKNYKLVNGIILPN
jgi:uncharacterized protein Usg